MKPDLNHVHPSRNRSLRDLEFDLGYLVVLAVLCLVAFTIGAYLAELTR